MKQIVVLTGFAVVFTIACETQTPRHAVTQSATYYVMAGAPSGGDGAEANPFNNLANAEAASKEGETIYLLPGKDDAVLDGGIALKAGQKLIGRGPDGNAAAPDAPSVRVTNSTNQLDGTIVRLSEGNEVAGIHFVDMRNHAIHGADTDYSGAHIHHNRFTGSIESEELILCVLLEAESGAIHNVTVTDCVFRDGEDLSGVQVMHTDESTGEYEFARNDFSDLGGRAYLVWSRGASRIQSRILDSVADNIGRGGRNSDSIDPRLWGSSEQNMYVRNYRYNNTKQVGSRSNTGFEAFMMGEPFPDKEEWCDGCKLTLEIVDSRFENTVTDGIQLTNYGSNSVLDVVIRNTKVIGAQPKQAGGAISFIAQNQYNTGSQSKLLVENCDIIRSSRYAFAVLDRSGEYVSVVDLGGGPLGSKGNNRIIDCSEGEVLVVNANPVGKQNWWSGKTPRVEIQGDASSIVLEPALTSDPRSD